MEGMRRGLKRDHCRTVTKKGTYPQETGYECVQLGFVYAESPQRIYPWICAKSTPNAPYPGGWRLARI